MGLSIRIFVENEVHTNMIHNILFTFKCYPIGLSWKAARKILLSNYSNSLAMLKGLTRKLKETPEPIGR